MKGGSQKGITLTLQVKDIDTIWNEFEKTGLKPTPIKKHSWDAHTFLYMTLKGTELKSGNQMKCKIKYLTQINDYTSGL